MEETVSYHDRDRVRVGGVVRYDIELGELSPEVFRHSSFVRVRNTESVALRAAYLNGPFTIYCDMMPMHYDEHKKVGQLDEPRYENHVKASSHFSAESKVPRSGGPQRWRVTIMSEILFSRTAEVKFEITIGTSRTASKSHGHHADHSFKKYGIATASNLKFQVSKTDTIGIWQQPLPRPNEPLHVCVLTHGLVSNVTADMLYVKELIDGAARKTGENLVCKGYTGNVCRTEKGVKYLGKRLADWLVNELIPTYRPTKMSFIAHSLGGLIQTYALGYIQATCPQASHNIELVNFVALASPMLGISNENPGYVQFALNFGVVGVTGSDLGLSHIPGVTKPLLEQIPNTYTSTILRRFRHRTVYANAVNDGIVPLRTASLSYSDWRAIVTANAAHNNYERSRFHRAHRVNGNSGNGDMEMNKEELELMHDQQRDVGKGAPRRRSSKPEHADKEKTSSTNGTMSSATTNATNTGTTNSSSTNATDVSSTLNANTASLDASTTNSSKTNNFLTSANTDSTGQSSSSSDSSPSSSEESTTNGSKPKTPSRLNKTISIDPPRTRSSPSQGSPSSDKSSVKDTSSTFSQFSFGHTRQSKIIRRSQTVNSDDEDLDLVGEQSPRKTSSIESGMSSSMPPHPDRAFITDPTTRDNVIFHDRIYYQQDLPERRFKSRLHIIKGQKEKVEVARSEERIARKYHSGTSWRKVLVEMLPEAHNNIIVRRRFSNAYGWPVIDHLVTEHFVHPAAIDQEAEALSRKMADLDIKETSTAISEDADSTTTTAITKEPENIRDNWMEIEEPENEPDRDLDPHRASMLKIIPSSEDLSLEHANENSS